MARRKPLPIPLLSSDTQKLFDVLNGEGDMPAVLIATSYLDECLAALLHQFMVSGSTTESLLSPVTGALGSFSARADLAYSLGLINTFAFKDLKTIGNIRNAFAHSHLSVSFSSPQVQDLTAALGYLAVLDEEMNMNNASVGDSVPMSKTAASPRDRFVMTVVMLSSQLLLLGLGLERRVRSDAFVQSYSKKLAST